MKTDRNYYITKTDQFLIIYSRKEGVEMWAAQKCTDQVSATFCNRG